jgi:hypothetical protein
MKLNDKTSEPPSCLQPPILMIGRDSRGTGLLRSKAVHGGLFVDRAGALKFAKTENGNHPHAVVWVSGTLELNTGFAPAAEIRPAPTADRLRPETPQFTIGRRAAG